MLSKLLSNLFSDFDVSCFFGSFLDSKISDFSTPGFLSVLLAITLTLYDDLVEEPAYDTLLQRNIIDEEGSEYEVEELLAPVNPELDGEVNAEKWVL